MSSPTPSADPYIQRIGQLERMLQDATQTIKTLQTSMAAIQAEPPKPAPNVVTETPVSPSLFSSASVVRARPPDPFDGTDITLAPGFIQALEQYLALVTFTSESAKLELAITYFRLPAQRWVLGAHKNKQFKTFADLAARFRTVYSIDVDTELEISLDQLTSLRQADNQSVSEHYANFLALSFAAGAADDASNSQLFFRSLKFPLRRSMLRDANFKRGDIKTVLATAIRHERAFLASRNAAEAPPTPRRQNQQPAYAPLPAAPPILQRLGNRVSTPAPANDPMDLDAAQVGTTPARRPRLTPEERQRRVDNNLCIVCGEAGHYRDACPHSTFRRQRPVALNAIDAAPQQAASAQLRRDFDPEVYTPPDHPTELAYLDTANWESDDAQDDFEFDHDDIQL